MSNHYEAAWRAAGNQSRIVIDTAIKVGDRVRATNAAVGHRTVVGIVDEITYQGTFQGYVQRGSGEPWPSFVPFTNIGIDCGDDVRRSSYLDGVTKLLPEDKTPDGVYGYVVDDEVLPPGQRSWERPIKNKAAS